MVACDADTTVNLMIDLWARLHDIFEAETEGHPEIEIGKLTPQSTMALVDYMLVNSKNLETAFTMREPFQQVYIPSPQVVGKFLASGAVLGELWLAITVEQCPLPEMAIFVDGPDYISMEYRMGMGWNGVTLTGLFEFFRFVKRLEPNARIGLSAEFFSRQWRYDFDLTLQDYLNEKH